MLHASHMAEARTHCMCCSIGIDISGHCHGGCVQIQCQPNSSLCTQDGTTRATSCPCRISNWHAADVCARPMQLCPPAYWKLPTSSSGVAHDSHAETALACMDPCKFTDPALSNSSTYKAPNNTLRFYLTPFWKQTETYQCKHKDNCKHRWCCPAMGALASNAGQQQRAQPQPSTGGKVTGVLPHSSAVRPFAQ
jgi:hypothetical protein